MNMSNMNMNNMNINNRQEDDPYSFLQSEKERR
jgi:hypothetical protein